MSAIVSQPVRASQSCDISDDSNPSGSGVLGPSVRPLGNKGKSSALSTPLKGDISNDFQELRRDKWRLKNYARRLYLKNADFESDIGVFEVYKSLPAVVKCRHLMISDAVSIGISDGKAGYSGLSICKSAIACAVCCSAYMEAKRLEIAAAVDAAYGMGLKAIMVTFTFPHYEFQSCADLLSRQAGAFKTLRQASAYRSLRSDSGYSGLIRSLECLYGSNGWHPHTHELFFVSPGTCCDDFHARLLPVWKKACKKHGLIPRGRMADFEKHSVNVRDNASCSEYLAKADEKTNFSGVDYELTKSFLKSNKGLHPFQLLALAGEGDSKAGDLFLEYCSAFKGRALIYFQGPNNKTPLLDFLQVDRNSLCSAKPELESVGDIDIHAWREIRRGDATLPLCAAESGGSEGLKDYLSSMGFDLLKESFSGELCAFRDESQRNLMRFALLSDYSRDGI